MSQNKLNAFDDSENNDEDMILISNNLDRINNEPDEAMSEDDTSEE